MRILGTLVLVTLFVQNSYSRTKVLTTNRVVKDNKNCDLTGSCELKSIKLLVDDIKISSKHSVSYGTRALLAYKTKNIEDLKDYGIVQFIKGCQFHTTEDGRAYGGTVVPEFFGKKYQKYMFREWVIDSLDKDPLYNSWKPKKDWHSRHDLYRWSSKGASFDSKGDKYFWKHRPKVSELYVTDRPGVTSYDKERKTAKNISLKFKSCVFKMEDVEMEMGPNDLRAEDGLVCVEWASSFIFNHSTKKFETKKEIDPFCK